MTSNSIQTFLSGFQKSGLVNRILITGGNGVFGRDLTPYLQKLYGADNILITDIHNNPNVPDRHYKHLDVTNKKALEEVCQNFKADAILHLASLTPKEAEENPALSLKVDTEGTRNVIEVATQQQLRIFGASSVETFGSWSHRRNVPDVAVQRPETMQGITKFYLEMMGNYHRKRYGTDFRAIRYPVIISPTFLPGKVNSDVIEMYYAALTKKQHKCPLNPERLLPSIFVDDAVIALIKLLEAPKEKLLENTFNISGCSFSPDHQVASIKKHIPDFSVKYVENGNGDQFSSWPETFDDSLARDQWGFEPLFGLDEITAVMLEAGKKNLRLYKQVNKETKTKKSA